MLVYPAGIDLSTRSLCLLTDLLHARRRERGTRWQRLPADRPHYSGKHKRHGMNV